MNFTSLEVSLVYFESPRFGQLSCDLNGLSEEMHMVINIELLIQIIIERCNNKELS